MRTRLFFVAAPFFLAPPLVAAIATAAPQGNAPATAPSSSPSTPRGANESATHDGKKPPKPKPARQAGDEAPPEKTGKTAKPKRTASAASASKPPSSCMKPPIEIAALNEIHRFNLARCDGTPAPLAVEHLSIAMRAGGVAKPKESVIELARVKGDKLATGIRRADPGLVARLQKVIDHFGADAKKPAPKVLLVSGYRPASHGSKHSEARALDFKLDSVSNEELLAFCKTLDDTGCGYYPNSTFVHMDVRDVGAGHVSWIDASGPGESPRYVTTWPPAKDSAVAGKDAPLAPPSPLAPARDDSSERLEDVDSLPALPMPDGDLTGPFTR